MKICLIGNPQSIHFKRWALSLSEKGIDICTLSISHQEGLDNIRHFHFSYPKTIIANAWNRRRHFKKLLSHINADLYHMHQINYASYIKPLINSGKLVITPYGSELFWKLSPKKERLKNKMFQKASCISATSKFLLNEAGTSALDHKKKLIHFGINTNKFRPLGSKKKNSFVIGFVKHLIPYYGVESLLYAFEKLLPDYEQVKLHIYGEGPQKEMLECYISEKNLENFIILFGKADHDTLPGIYNSFDLFVMPSICPEAFGVVALEAQACGVPVIASDIGGIPETLVNNKTGLLFEPGNSEQLADCIKTLIENPDTRASMSQEAVRWVSKFEWDFCVDKMITCYESLRI